MTDIDPNLYNVAWIAPLEIEAQAALHMLDNKHQGRFPVRPGDDYIFEAGSMSGHNIVIATLPAGQEYGTGSAAALASQVKKCFPNLWFGLLVGVAAGLPNLFCDPPRDIRLGDVLVALPIGENAGIVAYDLGKATSKDTFEPLRLGHALATTEAIVRSAIGSIRLKAPNDTEIFLPYYEKIKSIQHATGDFRDPGQGRDRLYEALDDGSQTEMERPLRPEDRRTRVWYGSIGSGEKLMRNSRQRNELRDRYNIIGLEMEAAGTMNRIPVGVIRGVCDYGDEHKNKEWQPYAAAMAAAYAKAVLSEISPSARGRTQRDVETATQRDNGLCKDGFDKCLVSYPSYMEDRGAMVFKHNHTIQRESSENQTLQQTSMENYSYHQNRVWDRLTLALPSKERVNSAWPEYQNERPSLASRFLDRHDIPLALRAGSDAWNTNRRTPWSVVIHGLAGVGKSQICLKAIMENEAKFRCIFYLDASNNTSASNDYMDIAQVCGLGSLWKDMGLDEKIRQTRLWLGCQEDPWLLMMDNADSTDVSLAKYIPTRGPGTILITTMDERVATCSSVFDKIDPMDDRDALDLLLSYKRPGLLFDQCQQDAARVLAVDLLGGLPLAIAQAGSYVFNKYCTYTDYCDEFRRSPQAPLSYEMEQWSSYQKPIWTTFSLTLQRIEDLPERASNGALELLRTLSFMHHEDIHDSLACSAWNDMDCAPEWLRYFAMYDATGLHWDSTGLQKSFEILCRYSLLNSSQLPKRQYSMHRLVGTMCRETLSREQQNKYMSFAMSMLAAKLSGVKTPLAWVENPSGFELQGSLLLHIKACVEGRLRSTLEAQTGHIQEMKTHMILLFAKAYSATGHYSEARELLIEVCDILKTINAPEVLGRVSLKAMEQLAACDACLGHHVKACEQRTAIVAAYNPTFQPAEDLNAAMMNLADSLWMTGEHQQALGMSQRVLCQRQEKMKPSDPRLIRTRRKVAEYLHGSNRRREALEMREQSLSDTEVRENPTEVEYLDILSTSNALADSYQWDGQLLKALGLREEVYEGRLKFLGPKHPDTLLAFDRVLGTKSRISQSTESKEEICERRELIVHAWKTTLGDEHPYTLEARVNLGHSYSAIGRWDYALKEQKAVLDVRECQVKEERMAKHDPSYLSSMGNVANILFKMGNSEEALGMRIQAQKVAEDYYGENDRTALRLSHHVATCQASRGVDQLSKMALETRRSILERQRRLFDENDPDILTTMSLLAAHLAYLGEREESIQIRRDLLTKQRSVFGERNHDTLKNMKKLAKALADGSSSQEHQEAADLMEKVEQIEIESLGEDNPHAQKTKVQLYRIYRSMRVKSKPRRVANALASKERQHRLKAIENPKPKNKKRRRTSRMGHGTPGRVSFNPSKVLKITNPDSDDESPPVFHSSSSGSSSSEKYSGESGSEASDSGLRVLKIMNPNSDDESSPGSPGSPG